jgi:choline dehydrogenase
VAEQGLPRYADSVVVGGGTAGAVIAGRLAEQAGRSVLVLEAGPDYGPFAAGGWPRPLLDAHILPVYTHDWEYMSSARHGQPGLRLERARVLGGCSAHNGCIAIWGSRADYDGWAALGNPGWDAVSLLPFFQRANRQMRVRSRTPEEVTPWHRAVLDAAPRVGVPWVEDLNDLDQDAGSGLAPVNIVDGVRWNAAFAYLDPVRGHDSLRIAGNILVDRVHVARGRVTGLQVIGPEGPALVETGQVILCGGAYGSPAILLRSGIGAPDDLRALGIEPVHPLPGVGQNLHDHPAMMLTYSGTPALIAAMEAYSATGRRIYEEHSILKARSPLCARAFDLHIYPVGGRQIYRDGSWFFSLPVAVMDPRSRGSLRLTSRDPQSAPMLDHGYLSDPDDHDLAVLLEGVVLARSLARQSPLADLIGDELAPGAHLLHHDELRAAIQTGGQHYYHPVGTCKMGPAADPLAVVDASGRVHGLEGLLVADASIMPVIPRANTNIPTVVVGEKIAAILLEDT